MKRRQISQDTFHSFSTGCFLLFLLLHPRSSQAPHFRPLSLSHPVAYMACVPSLTASRRLSRAGLNPHHPKHNNKPFLPCSVFVQVLLTLHRNLVATTLRTARASHRVTSGGLLFKFRVSEEFSRISAVSWMSSFSLLFSQKPIKGLRNSWDAALRPGERVVARRSQWPACLWAERRWAGNKRRHIVAVSWCSRASNTVGAARPLKGLDTI